MKPYQTKADAEAIGKRVRSARISTGLTQEKLSEILNIGVGHMGKTERGKETLSTNVLLKISQYFDLTLDELILGEKPEEVPKTPAVYKSKLPKLLHECTPEELSYCYALLLQTLKYLRTRKINSLTALSQNS